MAARRLPLEQALLGFLLQGPAHGYDLHRQVQDELGRVWYVGISSVYAALQQLEDDGLVQSTVVAQADRPARKVFQVTAGGREHFVAWVRRPVLVIRDVRVEFVARLYFFRVLALDGVEHLISEQESVCRQQLERLAQDAAECAPDDFYRLVVAYRKGQIEATLNWLHDCQSFLSG
ncbi:MAG: helix-turn-helix transcriptional regulator [Anaerolineae bacterium]|nr:helix-turn-helix transcriptional regulator [Anaerolineae bacterium]